MLFKIVEEECTDVTGTSAADMYDVWEEVGMRLEARGVEPVYQVLVSY